MKSLAFAVAALSTVPAIIVCSVSAEGASQEAARNLDTHHLFTAPSSMSDWKKRAGELRRRLLVSQGLWPMPEKTPLNPRVTGRFEGPDFIVENVALETRPGFFLCGNLYRPKDKKGPFPGIANPHGHWAAGRMHREADVPKADPNASTPAPGKADLVALPANLAKQGHVVFAYDMVGYNDTNQVDHKFAGSLNAWAWNVSLSGLQTWNSIRVVDFLQSLPYVDKKRIGVTGASGGGTQTFLLAALDDRVKASVPVNMVSAHMQGGCLCENGPGLRVGTDNPEIAALFAPKPQLLISCTGDWTKNNPKEEYPRVKEVYSLFGAADKLANRHFNYGHNYNVESREAMYAFFGEHLLGDSNPDHFREAKVDLDPKTLKVWTDKDPRPSNALNAEALLNTLISECDQRIRSLHHSKLTQVARQALITALGMPDYIALRLPKGKGRTVLLVSASRDWLEQAAKVAESAPGKVTVMKMEISPGNALSEKQLWDAFYSTYNECPVGVTAAAIVGRMMEARNQGSASVDVIGDGIAGPYVLFARAASGIPGTTISDIGVLKGSPDSFYLGELFAPGIRAAGGWQAAALMCPGATLYAAEGVEGLEDLKSRAGKTKIVTVAEDLSPDKLTEILTK